MSNGRGGLAKMNFRAFRENDFLENNAVSHAEYAAMINPASISRTLNVVNNKKGSRGSAHTDGQWMGLESETLTFDLIFDGTGIVDTNRTDVDKEIKKFLKVVYVDPENNKATFVEIVYGKLNVLCKLQSMTINYQLFDRQGHPIRAKLACSFITVRKPKPEDKDKNKKKEKKQEQPASNGGNCCTPCYDDLLYNAQTTNADSLNPA